MKTASVDLPATYDRWREKGRERSIESKISHLSCLGSSCSGVHSGAVTAQWGVQFISGQIRKQETPIMNHIDDNDATMQQ